MRGDSVTWSINQDPEHFFANHAFVEKGSRYNLVCVYCGRQALDERRERTPCPSRNPVQASHETL